jgi:hypothetical protein
MFTADDEVKLFCATMVGRTTTNFFEGDIRKVPEQWQRCIEVLGNM